MGGVSTNLLEVLKRFIAPPQQALGDVYPPRTDGPNLPDLGGREIALRRFCDFLSNVPFMRTMQGPAQPFLVPRDQIHVNQPANVAGASDGVKLPYIAFLTSSNDNTVDPGFLGPAIIDDDSADVFAPDTAVFWIGDHIEELQIEVVAAGRSVRRAIVEGIKQVLRATDAGPLKLSLPDYFNEVATFTLIGDSYIEDQDAVRNRRRDLIRVQLYMSEVALASAVDLHTSVSLQVDASVRVRAADSSST